jgi:hypothetical protein
VCRGAGAPHATAADFVDGPAQWGEAEGERIILCLPRAIMERDSDRESIPAAVRLGLGGYVYKNIYMYILAREKERDHDGYI